MTQLVVMAVVKWVVRTVAMEVITALVMQYSSTNRKYKGYVVGNAGLKGARSTKV